MKLHIIFWIIFGAIALVLALRLSGSQVPASIVFLLAGAIGALGLFVFVANMRSARRSLNELFGSRLERPPEETSAEKKQ